MTLTTTFAVVRDLVGDLPIPAALVDGRRVLLACNTPFRERYRSPGPCVGTTLASLWPAGPWDALAPSASPAETVVTVETEGFGCLPTRWRDSSDATRHGYLLLARRPNVAATRPPGDLDAADHIHDGVGLSVSRVDGTWVKCNASLADLLQLDAERLAAGAVSTWDLTPPGFAVEESAQLEALYDHGRFGPYDKEFVRSDGTTVPVRVSGFLIDNGTEAFVWQTVHERVVQHRSGDARSPRTSALLTELAKLLAHQLNNPLQVIESHVWVAQTALDDGDSAECRIALGEISAGVSRLAGLVADLRALAPDAPREPTESLDLRDILLAAVQVERDDLPSMVRVRVRCARGLRVIAPHEELVRIVAAIIRFAAAAVSAALHPDREADVTIAVTGEFGVVRMLFSDDVGALLAQTAHGAFDPFDPSDGRHRPGRFSLTIARELARRSGAALTFDTRRTNGALVLELPRALDDTGRTGEDAGSTSEGGPTRG